LLPCGVDLPDNPRHMSARPSPAPDDLRSQRSRAAILGAFFGLVLERRYHEITVGGLIRRAGVARSTFYEHFRGKDELLAESLRGPFTPLVMATEGAHAVPALTGILSHFWDHRRLAPGVFQGAVGHRAQSVLTAMLARGLAGRGPWRVADAVLAEQLSALQFGTITAWLGGRIAIEAEPLARSLVASTVALVDAQRIA
jgi:AcrR family transcriptional regulator